MPGRDAATQVCLEAAGLVLSPFVFLKLCCSCGVECSSRVACPCLGPIEIFKGGTLEAALSIVVPV